MYKRKYYKRRRNTYRKVYSADAGVDTYNYLCKIPLLKRDTLICDDVRHVYDVPSVNVY